MPEFILDTSGQVPPPAVPLMWPHPLKWRDLSSFAQGYVEALFFTESAPGVTTDEWQAAEDHDEGSIPGDVGFSDLAPGTLLDILRDCEAFEREAAELLEEAYGRGYSEERAGHDFWLTRNGHGAGFWDREELETGELGERLSDAARRFGEVWSYLGGDGRVYVQ